MEQVTLSSLDFYSIGTEITLFGAIYARKDKLFLVPFPDQPVGEFGRLPMVELVMNHEEMAKFLNQSDVLDVVGPNKAILRKSQRHIDRAVMWEVFERDDYRCRYCGKRGPLTVDHVILWEEGGATVAQNLITACGKCNKLRGRMQYDEWVSSKEYGRVSYELSSWTYHRNLEVLTILDELKRISVKVRSR